jgi:hypothetical protein
MLYLLKRSRRRKLNSKISFLQKNPVFKAKPSRRPQSLCVRLTKLPPCDEITRFDGMPISGSKKIFVSAINTKEENTLTKHYSVTGTL